MGVVNRVTNVVRRFEPDLAAIHNCTRHCGDPFHVFKLKRRGGQLVVVDDRFGRNRHLSSESTLSVYCRAHRCDAIATEFSRSGVRWGVAAPQHLAVY